MSDQNTQTILVKKPDGTFVRVPLSDIPKMQTSVRAVVPATKPVAPVVVKPVEKEKVVASVPVHHKEKSAEVKHTTPHVHPIHQAVLDHKEKTAKKMEKPRPLHVAKKSALEQMKPGLSVGGDNDGWSLLDEPAPSKTTAGSFTSDRRDEQVDSIVSKLSFKVSAGNSNRLRTVIQLFLKDVRSAEQTREILERREIDGGLGLTGVQTGELLEKAGYKNPLKPIVSPMKPENTGLKITKTINTRLEKELPQTYPPLMKRGQGGVQVAPSPTPPSPPSSSTSPSPSTPPATKQALDTAVTRATLADVPAMMPSFKISSETRSRMSMADVTVKPLEMTPVDEILFFTLVDFRRLAPDPLEAARRLKQKFFNLKDESIVLYLEALAAWQRAPLFHDYLNLVSESLAGGVPLQSLTQDKKRIQLPEIMALVDMEKAFI
jgi:hypothetical protein